ncbi:hypothetical protein BJF93_18575 [Xaviernesmea oryzae]|uniref:HTH araC/xylS-type domain-containing protein n=1 Tax=Xaviernesmea oryzae TaxID=464029 RepID=A0A1Q9B2K3_9HYPH|nr:AraC family transcriptional regulator [Xaviernesmea oryzae]OLP62228.1 hypothetical protein BJF93_18575 [Xaviernesmea oryzae]SEL92541.1 transcriptional regulator, AraC family [Xaviernesmea oryzae]
MGRLRHQEFRRQSLCLQGVEAVEAESAHVFGRHMHEHYGIGLILAGAQRSASGRGPVEAVAGDVITVNPGEVHDGAPIGSGRHWCMLYFDPALLDTAAREIAGRSGCDYRFEAPVLSCVETAARFAALYRHFVAPDCEAMAAEEQLLLLLGQLGNWALRTPSRHGARLSQARMAIDDSPEIAHSLAALAASSGLSRFQFLRAFSAETGLTPHAYLIQRRLQKARRLLMAGQSAAEAALASGFADQAHMTRSFSRAYGLTPGRFAASR